MLLACCEIFFAGLTLSPKGLEGLLFTRGAVEDSEVRNYGARGPLNSRGFRI